MEHIYIAFVNTPGIFAAMIHYYLKQKYIHVVLSMDPNLEEAYSMGRRNPAVPIIAGFEREEKEKIYRVFPGADYKICEIEVTAAQKRSIRRQLERDYRNRYSYHYAVLGLLPLLLKMAFYQEGHFTCSSYIARLLEENGIRICDKHFSLVTPKDFYYYPHMRTVFEGKLAELVDRKYPPVERRWVRFYEYWLCGKE